MSSAYWKKSQDLDLSIGKVQGLTLQLEDRKRRVEQIEKESQQDKAERLAQVEQLKLALNISEERFKQAWHGRTKIYEQYILGNHH